MFKKLHFVIIAMLSFCIGNAQIPANDLIENATEITNGNFIDENVRLDLATATGGGAVGCALDGFQRVYYKFTVSVNTQISAALTDSNNINSLNPNSFLIPYTSNSIDASSDTELTILDAQLCAFGTTTTFNAIPGINYYIMVHRSPADAGALTNVSINVPEQSSQSDRDALVAFYNANNGPNWTESFFWNSSFAVGSWQGVTVENGRVTKVEVPFKNLVGTTLAPLLDLTELTTINLFNNNLSGPIPDFSVLTQLENLDVSLNNFSFADFEANFSQNETISNFRFNTQRVVDLEQDIEGIIGNDYTFTMTPIAGSDVDYQWFEGDILPNGNAIAGATSNNFTITNTQAEDLNVYYCQATSPLVPGLILNTPPIDFFGEVSQAERDALIAIYNATDGANWTDNTNWLSNAPVREWRYVQTQGNKVTGLEFINSNLSGTLPPELGDLPNLKLLSIALNSQLSGSIPTEIGNLANLEQIQIVGNNNLTGSLPTSLGNLSELITLRIFGNPLTGEIPSSLGSLSNLRGINLLGTDFGTSSGSNYTGSIPASINNLTNLTLLAIGHNSLTGSIPDISNMTSLIGIELDSNNLSGELADLSLLPNLVNVDISDNLYSFSDLSPNQASNLALETYIFSPQRNTSVEEFPQAFVGSDIAFSAGENLDPNNTYTWFKDNFSIPGANSDTYEITDVQTADAGVYFCEIGNTVVENLFIRRANITLDVVFEDAPQVERDALIAFYNANGGVNWTNSANWTTSEPVGSWHGVTVENGQVTDVFLPNNNIVGSDLVELLNLSNLKQLELGGNQISGLIPDFSLLADLELLVLRNNNFTFADFEPNFIANNTASFNFIYAGQNRIDEIEEIEGIIGNDYTITMTPVAGTNVQYQWFTGAKYGTPIAIPGETSNVLSLNNLQPEDLEAYTCRATSSLVPDLFYQRNHFELFGPVSQEDRDALIAIYNATDGANWTDNTNWLTSAPVRDWAYVFTEGNKVTNLNFFNANLGGSLPPELGDLEHLKRISIALNGQLNGPIPEEFGNLSNLNIVQIAGNDNLTGSLPQSIGNLTELTSLRIFGNPLSGEIPSSIGNLTKLVTLNLLGIDFGASQGSNYTGSIPASVNNLTNLSIFALSENSLTGEIPDMSNMVSLTGFEIASNNLSGEVADFSLLPNFVNLDIANNQFSFADLATNQAKNETIDRYLFSPQRNSSEPETIETPPGQSITLNANGATTTGRVFWERLNTDQYQWFKDDVAINGATEATYTIANPQPEDSGIYFCEITNTTVDGLVITRADITLNVNAALSIEDVEFSNFKLYPNPATNWITVTANELANSLAEVYDLNGRLIYKTNLNTNTNVINIETLTSGVYLLKIIGKNNQTTTKRFIKN